MDLSILKKSEPRIFHMVLFSVTMLTLLASGLYVFKKPLKEYQTLKQNRSLLQNKVLNSDSLEQAVSTLVNDVSALKKKIEGENPDIPPNELIAHTIEKLDLISNLQGVELIRVKPEKEESASLFKKIPFRIEVVGDYFDLYQWLYQVESDLGPMVIQKFDIKRDYRVSKTSQLIMQLNMASYRLRRNN